MEVTPTTSGLSLSMPPANQTSVGTDTLIYNKGAYAFTLKDDSGGTIVSIPANPSGNVQYIYLTTNSTVAGTWGVIAFGTGTGSASASTLAGLGLLAISSTLNQSHPVNSATNGYVFSASDRAQVVSWTGGTGSATLPLASVIGNNWFVLFKNNGTGTYNVNCSGANIIDQNPSLQFNPNESAFICCDGTQFITVGYGQSNVYQFNILTYPVTGGTYNLTPSNVSNLIQEYVGTLVSNVTAVYPPVVNLYVISNQTVDNGHSLTITTGITGGTNAIIPPGQQATVVCDGTNFFNANTVQAGATSINLVNGTVTTPALNFGAETSTGIWRNGAGQFDISILGTNRFSLTATGLDINGYGNFFGGISGGTF
jgi:hypothetical protein